MSGLLQEARARDAGDGFAGFRERFHIPEIADATDKNIAPEGAPTGALGGYAEQAYFCGNSLGLQPKGVREALLTELEDWAKLGVEAHFRGRHPWMPYHSEVRDGLAALVGALPSEVVAMNSLTANLHLLMVSFYRPTPARPAILIEAGAFPSDRYLVESQIRFHGYDPATDLIELEPDEAGGTISLAAIERVLGEHGHRIALVLWPGVQYRTGQAFELKEIVRLARAQGCNVGFDLAHGAGNLALQLHDSGCDFAAWCHYKYCNSGPGAVAGAFVHDMHARADLPRFAGWWGHEQSTRFRMGPHFQPTPGADGWQLSNPPILALAPLRVSLELFAEAGMDRLRAKSERLTGFLEQQVRTRLAETLEILTPAEPQRRGCQLSLRVAGGRERGRALFEHLEHIGIVGDWREPDVIRISPVPLYNTFEDIARFVLAVEAWRG